MATEVTDNVAITGARDSVTGGLNQRSSSETFTDENYREQDADSSFYTLASQSQFSRDVDHWIRGGSIQTTGVQNSRTNLVQRSTLTATASLGISSVWYALAMILPLFSININCNEWRYNPSNVLSKAQLLYVQISAICQSVRNHVRRLAGDQMVRDMIATAMDVMLLVYAVGFLVISMYQASMIG